MSAAVRRCKRCWQQDSTRPCRSLHSQEWRGQGRVGWVGQCGARAAARSHVANWPDLTLRPTLRMMPAAKMDMNMPARKREEVNSLQEGGREGWEGRVREAPGGAAVKRQGAMWQTARLLPDTR